jgi:hypothetical protein
MGAFMKFSGGRSTRLLALLTIVTFGLAPLPALGAPAWHVVPVPAPPSPTRDLFASVSCPAAGSCTAVGSGDSTALVERKLAAGWSTVATPKPVGRTLTAVACVSGSDCYAVGTAAPNPQYSRTPLAERWNGTAWSSLAISLPPGAVDVTMLGLACTSDAMCIAVGAQRQPASWIPLVEQWNGATWSNVATPVPSNSTFSEFRGVTCTSASACTAVGDDAGPVIGGVGSPSYTMVQRWNGTTWSLVSTPNPASSFTNGLNAVACPSAMACWAAGYQSDSNGTALPLIERLQNGAWSIVVTPAAPSGAALNGIACATTSTCFAVGGTIGGAPTIERWNGATWAATTGPVSTLAYLAAVSCTTSTSCDAVGWRSSAVSYAAGTLAEHWNGASWTKMTSVSRPGPQTGQLSDVACTTATSCDAVGTTWSAALAEHWDGTAWSIRPSPNPSGATGAALGGLACVTAANCWAVGNFRPQGGGPEQPLAEHWNGTAWSIVATPVPGGSSASWLTDVTCTSATNCWSVGAASLTSGGEAILIERWNGTSWSVASAPSPDLQDDLQVIRCPSATSCFAVGSYFYFGASGPLVEHWNGSAWSVMTLPAGAAELHGIACPSTTRCFAVGLADSGGTVAEIWNGANWSIQTTPTPSGSFQTPLNGVSCASTTDCNAVGSFVVTQASTLVEHWNGVSWSITSSPNATSTLSDDLTRVACTSASTCMAIGNLQRSGSGALQPFAEQLS